MRSIIATLVLLLSAIALSALCACSGESAASSDKSVPVRLTVNEYSWNELSLLSERIAATNSDESALFVAKYYHLVGDDGVLDGSQSKQVMLADGTITHAIVVGFNHDDKAGGGKAGITFAFADAVAVRGMNNNAGFSDISESDDFDAMGGWNACELRGWLNDDFMRQLPSDLQGVLVDVVKSSLVTPERELSMVDTGALTGSIESLIGQGVDKLWIPSLVELSGVEDSSATAKAHPEWTAPLKAEGSQYRLFADAEVSERHANVVLVRSLAGHDESVLPWWLRSVEGQTFAEVLANGSIDRRDWAPAASTSLGVVPFFAL